MRDAQTSGSRSLDSGLTGETRMVAAQKVWKTGIACMHRKLFLSSRGPCTPNIHRETEPRQNLRQNSSATHSRKTPFLVGHMLLIVGSSHVRARTVHGAARPARTHELPRCHPGAAFGLK